MFHLNIRGTGPRREKKGGGDNCKAKVVRRDGHSKGNHNSAGKANPQGAKRKRK